MATSTIIAVAGLAVSAGLGVYSAVANSGGGPKLPPAPPPAGATNYDSAGNVTSTQHYDAATNTWITKAGELTPAQQQDKAQRDALRQKMLTNLNETPEDRIKAYQDYANAVSTSMHQDVDQRFANTQRSLDESMNARGMTGSKAAVDLQTQLVQQKANEDVNIANQAQMAAQGLKQQDEQNYLNVLNSLDSGARTDTALEMQQQGLTNQEAQGATADLYSQYKASVDPTLQQWQIKQANMNDLTKNIGNTAVGLAYLYGYKGKTASTS